MAWIFIIAALFIVFALWCCIKVGSDDEKRYDRIFKERYGFKDDIFD